MRWCDPAPPIWMSSSSVLTPTVVQSGPPPELLVDSLADLVGRALELRDPSGGVALRILSNLADRSLVTARVRYELASLATRDFPEAIPPVNATVYT